LLFLNVVLDKITVHRGTLVVLRVFDVHIHSLIQEYFHLLLQKGVKLGLELLLRLLRAKTLMIDLLIVLFNSKSKDGLL
jgi:hypothetical protein